MHLPVLLRFKYLASLHSVVESLIKGHSLHRDFYFWFRLEFAVGVVMVNDALLFELALPLEFLFKSNLVIGSALLDLQLNFIHLFPLFRRERIFLFHFLCGLD